MCKKRNVWWAVILALPILIVTLLFIDFSVVAQMMKGMMNSHSMARHHKAMMASVPKPYRTMRNTQPKTDASIKQGKVLYMTHCSTCHGASGRGDGVAGKQLVPRPVNLKAVVQMPMFNDKYLMWAISEGGAEYKTAMPAFKNTLSTEDRWKIINFIRTL